MKYAYLGDHESVDLYGVHFPVGVFVEVSNEILLRKLAGNNHFCEEKNVIDRTLGWKSREDEPVVVETEREKPKRGRKPKAK